MASIVTKVYLPKLYLLREVFGEVEADYYKTELVEGAKGMRFISGVFN